MKDIRIYSVAMYLRLSKDDGDIDGRNKSESNSISSQRDLLRNFVRKQDDMELFDIYVDDGYSGANFDRPEFKRMMADIEKGKVNCVIVKDLSRLGRDYIEAGRLIQKTFPAFHVRFIAVTDNFDSLTADYNEMSLVLPVKNFVNDSYCRDISQKVKSQKKIKREQGKFIGSFAVYGYKKDELDKNQLVPDPYAAGIVKNIFAWHLEGMSMFAISERLNELGILSPMEYKKAHGIKYGTGFQTKTIPRWSPVAVKRILTNEVYTGTLVQGKAESVNYKVKKLVPKPESEWVRVTGTHEAIVSYEDYENVQRLLKVDIRASANQKKAHMFSGFLFCGDCKEPMIRRVSRYKGIEKVHFICQTRNKGQGCSRHSIAEEELTTIVFHTLQTYVSMFLDVSRQLANISEQEIRFEDIAQFDEEIRKLHREQDKYLQLRAGLYEDLKSGLITEEDFKNFRNIYEEQYKETDDALKKQEEMIKKIFRNGITSGVRLERFKEAQKITVLDRNALIAFINRIEVYEDKQIYIEFRGQEEFQKMLMLAELNAARENRKKEAV